MDWRCGICFVGIFLFIVTQGLLADPAVDPIAEREWTSDAGTKLLASALELRGDKVVFRLSDGRQIEVPVARLSESDQAILRHHFLIEESDPASSTEDGESDSSPLNDEADGEFPGEVREGIEAGDLKGLLATISAYVPSSADENANRPVFCYVDILKSSVESLDKLKAGSEVTGWPAVVSSEMSASFHQDYMELLTEGWLTAMDEKLPVDTERIYGIAYARGLDGLMSIEDEMGGYDGVLTVSGIFDEDHSRQSICYGMIGLGSSSRVNFTKFFKKKTGQGSVIRYTAEGRGNGSSDDYEDGMIYLAIQYYRGDGSLKSDELSGFVDRLLERAGKVSESDPERAYMWIMQSAGLKKSRAQREKWQALQTKLGKIERCRAYYKGLELFEDLGYKVIGDAESSVDEKANEKIERELQKMRKELKGTKWIPVMDSF